MAALRY
jgi:hypothetical protein